ncbi:ABC transporter substrate-binding protein [Teichococcus aestuarii]|uniref:ABC transporter substrate-binding protein n=1 Tax=Teichococcus aestuarii TaxID=568898 RepID=UPI003622E4EE
MADARVRRALSLAIDREALAARGLDGRAIATVQMVPEGFGGWDADLPAPRPDPEAARRLLAEAGFPQGFGLTIGCSNNRYTNDARVCQAVGQMLTRAGFQAKVETQPGTVFFPRTAVGRNDLPLMLFGLSLSSSRDASYILSTAVHTRDPARGFGQGNRGQFSDAALDARIAASISRMDAGREAALRETMREAIAALPIIPLYNQVTITAARRGLPTARGWTSNWWPPTPAPRSPPDDRDTPDRTPHHRRHTPRRLGRALRRRRPASPSWRRGAMPSTPAAPPASPSACCSPTW